MSIPIDKLYHYIENIAEEIYSNNIIIYRFYPHGSKKLEDLNSIRNYSFYNRVTSIPIYCYDQEPLNYQQYDTIEYFMSTKLNDLRKKYNIPYISNNIRIGPLNIYDKAILIHSEKKSKDVTKYYNNNFIPVYYWSHAIIALDWFRYAKYDHLKKNIKKQFLIYNRAWSNTREYRLKFADLLITHQLVDKCQITFNAIEPELGIHYLQHQYNNVVWRPNHLLEEYLPQKIVDSSASADYDIDDYNSTEFEVVLETLFDDARIQLTEKVLRPIALGQPFLLVSTCGSLEYLRSYGFKTFNSVIDEGYDTIEDPLLRLTAIAKSMKEISNWTTTEKAEKMAIVNAIAEYNRQHFFSGKFFNQVTNELRNNLKIGIEHLENSNTSKIYLDKRKQISKYKEIANYLLTVDSRSNLAKIIKKARSYYKRTSLKD